jgi:hypothetical protein
MLKQHSKANLSAQPEFGGAGVAKVSSPAGNSTAPPNTPTSTAESSIDRIAAGLHQDLPLATLTYLNGDESPGWTVENLTIHQLHVYLAGPVDRDYVIPTGRPLLIDLPPGTYRIAADVSDPSIAPFYGVREIPSGARWNSQFVIVPR